MNKCYKLKLFLQQFFISAAVLNAELPLNSRVHILEVCGFAENFTVSVFINELGFRCSNIVFLFFVCVVPLFL